MDKAETISNKAGVGGVDGVDDKFKFGPIALAVGIAVSAVLPVFLTGALAVQIRRSLSLSPSLLGAAVSTFFGFAALFSYFSGRISHKVNGAKVMRICLIASSLVLVGIATIARNYISLLVLLAVSGVINGSLQPPINLFLSNVIPKRRQGLAFGIKQAGVPISTLLAGISVPVIALTVGWRYAYLAVAPIGIILFFFVPKKLVPGNSSRSGPGVKTRPSPLPIAILAIAMGLGTGAANAFGAFLVTYVVHIGWKPAIAGLLTVGGSFLGASARVGNGIWADRRKGKHFYVAAWSAAIGCLGYLLFVAGQTWLIIPAVVVAYVAAWGWNGLFIFGVVRNFSKHAGYATGTVQSGAYVGSVIGPLGFGIVVEHLGWPYAWAFAAASSLAASIAIIIGRKLTMTSQTEAVG